MSLVYFDASAFVKLLAEEPGSDLAAQLWDDVTPPSRAGWPIPRCEPRWPQPLATMT
jgi:hypothetical protein